MSVKRKEAMVVSFDSQDPEKRGRVVFLWIHVESDSVGRVAMMARGCPGVILPFG